MTKISSSEIKAELERVTGVDKKLWSRWAKYKVGSPVDMQTATDPALSFCKGIRFGKYFPDLIGSWVRLFGAPSDKQTTGVAVFEKNGQLVDILSISETLYDCGAPEPGRLRDPIAWESIGAGGCQDGLDEI